MTSALEDRYDDRIAGWFVYDGWYHRTLPTVCYAEGMTRFLFANGIQIFKYPDFAMGLREHVRERCIGGGRAGITIEHIAKNHIRKEEVVAKVLEQRGDHPASCMSCQRWRCLLTGPGMTSNRTRLSCVRTPANVCTTTSIS